MPEYMLYFIAAAVFLALIPLAPSMMRLRIAVLRWLHWNWLARLHERHLDGFTLAARILLVLILGFANRYARSSQSPLCTATEEAPARTAEILRAMARRLTAALLKETFG